MAHSTAYEKYPEHTLEVDAQRTRVRVSISDVLVAESSNALTLREGRYPGVVYLPREDVDMSRLNATDETYHCPFKGDASFFDFQSGELHTPKVAWSYEDPFDQMVEIQGHLSFYLDRAQIEVFENE